MTAIELMDEINKLGVLELEQRLRKLNGEVAATKQLLKIALAKHKASRTKAKPKDGCEESNGSGMPTF